MAADIKSADPVRISLPRNTLVVLVGPAGCGKSTFASRHFRPTEIVSSDECRALISDDPSNQNVSSHAFELMHLIIEKRLLLGRLTVCDATNLERIARKPLLRIARRFVFNTAAILFDLPLDVCIQRNSGRRRVVPDDALRNQHAMFDKAKLSVPTEGFDQLFVLNQRGQSNVLVGISGRTRLRAMREKR